MDKNATKALRMILDNEFMTLSTCDSSMPWAAPMYYATDQLLNIYFVTSNRSRHAQHIASNPNVAIAIFDSSLRPEEQDGVQIYGLARQVSLRELAGVISIYYKRRFPNSAERSLHDLRPGMFSGIASKRFYCVQPLEIYTLDLGWTKGDRRVRVNLPMANVGGAGLEGESMR